MGITIHYQFRFHGSEKRAKEILREIADAARELSFAEVGDLWSVNYAADFNTPDTHTPMIPGEGEEKGKRVIDPVYRWAKIQYEPRANVILRVEDTALERQRKEEQRQREKKRLPRISGYIQHIWFGEGCEPTNIGLIHTGNSRLWTGSAFTKTQWAEEFVKAHVSVCALLKMTEQVGILSSIHDEAGFWEHQDITKLMDTSEKSLGMMASLVPLIQKLAEDHDATAIGPGLTTAERLKEYRLEPEDNDEER